ncbi:inositol 2-dehydrogenase [Virgibacillus litoralis]|uniref:Myo-inositol 2-dehydrogenase/D-chiro-inositol 1-dehydrogenase n=1 Tax=Virgibacillus litoralis TaxID=578221 RepID=A0ABS4HAG1_9BACI|nr:inositol 2-dehydrogenase [Virgibacillus litoralis]MBP1947892.1 myo-inositol 2-dehydrogenase/D-chiro-inositol 1-dehydrogenase [Virgibacillus litoralis]
MKKLKIGIIGAGRIGQLHARNAINSNRVELIAISDIYIENLEGTTLAHEVPIITTNSEGIFADPEIDAVFICSSTDTHVDFIKKAANAGKHIFCEKPISMNIQETHSALEVVKKAGVKFQIGFNRRYDKHFRKAYESVRAGKVGTPHIIKITSRDPEAPPESYIKKSGGMFMDMTIHDFDMIRYLSGQEVEEISVKAANLIDDSFLRNDDVDTAIITVTFEDGSLGVIDNSRQAVYGYDQRIEVFGNKGLVTVENEKQTNIQISTKEQVASELPKYFFLERYMDAYVDEVNEFASSILDNTELLCGADDGLKAEALALAAKISANENRTVKLSEINLNSSVKV